MISLKDRHCAAELDLVVGDQVLFLSGILRIELFSCAVVSFIVVSFSK